MTKLSGDAGAGEGIARRCGWCRVPLPVREGPGRPRKYCSQRCRQWDWVARQRVRELALGDGELIAARDELDRLHDDLYVLQCAVIDTERDLAQQLTLPEALDALRWLLEAAQPLAHRRIGSAP